MTLAQRIDSTLVAGFGEITIPVDFTELSWQILPLAESLAKAFDVRLRFVHAIDADASWRLDEVSPPVLRAAPHGRHVEVGVISGASDAIEAIIEYLRRADRPLLAMATHAHTPGQEVALGNVAGHVVRRAQRPVLVVGPQFDAGVHAEVRRLVVCVRSSHDAAILVPDALAWSRALDVPMEIITVAQPPAWSAYDNDLVDRTVEAIAPPYSAVTGLTLVGVRPGHDIVRYAAAVPGTLLALSNHAKSHRPQPLGNVAAHVIRETRTGVLLSPYDGV